MLWGEWDPVRDVMSDSAIIASAPSNDEPAKMFTPPGGGCAVYVYYASGIGATIARALLLDELKQIRIDDSAPFWLNKDTYLRFEVAPGTVDIYSWRATEQWHFEANEVGYFSSVAMRLRSHL